MVDIQDVYAFCRRLQVEVSAGFYESRTPSSVVITGEYFTYSGQLLSILIVVNAAKVSVKFFDLSKRLLFTEVTSSGISTSNRLLSFVHRSLSRY